MKRTLCIGDVHGHHDRLHALLEQEGVVDGAERVATDVEVIQLGDLGHFGYGQTRAKDHAAWCSLERGWLDLVLWGNHDRAVMDRKHRFAGYESPRTETFALMWEAAGAGKVKLAVARHGYLLTHAGLHPQWETALHATAASAEDVADLLDSGTPELRQAIDSISRHRGGMSREGGILWRDESEPLSATWPQVFGHTRGGTVRVQGDSYCVDVGDAHNGRLAALWLPEKRIAQVQL